MLPMEKMPLESILWICSVFVIKSIVIRVPWNQTISLSSKQFYISDRIVNLEVLVFEESGILYCTFLDEPRVYWWI